MLNPDEMSGRVNLCFRSDLSRASGNIPSLSRRVASAAIYFAAGE
jgi:hypothetical protein